MFLVGRALSTVERDGCLSLRRTTLPRLRRLGHTAGSHFSPISNGLRAVEINVSILRRHFPVDCISSDAGFAHSFPVPRRGTPLQFDPCLDGVSQQRGPIDRLDLAHLPLQLIRDADRDHSQQANSRANVYTPYSHQISFPEKLKRTDEQPESTGANPSGAMSYL